MPRTRIVCTLGPASDSEERIRALIRAGMSVARINFSHGTLEDHQRRVDRVRKIAADENAVIALLGDLSGPKLRVGQLPESGMLLEQGKQVRFVLSRTAALDSIPLDFAFLEEALHTGDRILLDDGTIEVRVDRVAAREVVGTVVTGGVLRSNKGVNLPNTALPIPSLTEKDRINAQWALEQDVEYLALSFVRRPADISSLRDFVRERGKDVHLIAKIEKPEAVAEIDAILKLSDGVMVARGDLGVEMPAEQVPLAQKMIIRKANALGIPVITATQMLESMMTNPRPTRAEASDVANAVLDGSDAVMLSGETAVGQYPVEAVQAMARIAEYAEPYVRPVLEHPDTDDREETSVTNAIGLNTVALAGDLNAKLIVTLTSSGYTARMIARHRPPIPILAVTSDPRVRRRLALVWGVQTALIPGDSVTERAVEAALEAARKSGLVHPGDRVVLTAGVPMGLGGQTNMVQVRTV